VRREATRVDPVPKTVALAMLAYAFLRDAAHEAALEVPVKNLADEDADRG
jgi:hypothetical protein